MSKKVVIIGGGIIGLCSAYYLQKNGHDVTVIDQGNVDSGASFVNAGYLVPSHIIPLSAPGMVKSGIKMMFNSNSPLFFKPQYNLDFLSWAWAFNKSCTKRHVKASIPILKNMALISQKLFETIKTHEKFNFQHEKKGLLMLCQTEKALEEEIELLHVVQQEGLEAVHLNASELKNLQPNLALNAIGATYYKCDSHTTPNEFMPEMLNYLTTVGVKIIKNETVEDFEINQQQITAIKTNKQTHLADEFVIAAGVWSATLAKKIGINLKLQAGKGYCINTQQNTEITIPSILVEAKVAITPMHGFTRFAGTMEIAGTNQIIHKNRVEAIAHATSKYYPNITLQPNEIEQAKCGLRPLSPDGLPFIGKTKRYSNVTIATGHAMMGWTLGPITGVLVSELIDYKKTSLDITMLNPNRKF